VTARADGGPAAGTLAVDLGGTNMRVAVVAGDGSFVDRDHAPTPHDATTIQPFLDLLERVREQHALEHAVIAVPGRVDHDTGTLLHAPNLPPAWRAQLNRAALEHELGLDVTLANDADVATVGEAFFGAGTGYRDVVYVTVSTGVGAGAVIDGRVLLPRRSGGEVGHTVIDRVAAAAGEESTVEGLGSGTALGRLAGARGIEARGADLVQLVRDGNADAHAVWDEAMFAVGIGIANLVHVLAPDVVVIGGGVGRNGELVLAPVRDAIKRYGPAGTPPDVAAAALGDDPGLMGAAAWRRATGHAAS
jgi:glucokinase